MEIAHRLCLQADVVTNNFRTGVSARLGIDAKTLHRMKPQLVVLESSAYGATGPKSGRAGFDMAFQALCGHEHRAGGRGNPPLWNRTSMVDYAGGLMGAIAILQALHNRAREGGGAELNVALMNAGIFLLSELIQRADETFAGAPPLCREQTGYHPAEQMYRARDGWLAVAARDDTSARALAEVLGLDMLKAKTRVDWNADDAGQIAKAVRLRAVEESPAGLRGRWGLGRGVSQGCRPRDTQRSGAGSGWNGPSLEPPATGRDARDRSAIRFFAFALQRRRTHAIAGRTHAPDTCEARLFTRCDRFVDAVQDRRLARRPAFGKAGSSNP